MTLYLARLVRLTRLRVDYVDLINDTGLRLLDRCIAATVSDCCDEGEAEAAGDLLFELSMKLQAQGRAL